MDLPGQLFAKYKNDIVASLPAYERRLLLAGEPRLLARLDLLPAADLPSSSDKKQGQDKTAAKRGTSDSAEAALNTLKERIRTLLVDKVTDLSLPRPLPTPATADLSPEALASPYGRRRKGATILQPALESLFPPISPALLFQQLARFSYPLAIFSEFSNSVVLWPHDRPPPPDDLPYLTLEEIAELEADVGHKSDEPVAEIPAEYLSSSAEVAKTPQPKRGAKKAATKDAQEGPSTAKADVASRSAFYREDPSITRWRQLIAAQKSSGATFITQASSYGQPVNADEMQVDNVKPNVSKPYTPLPPDDSLVVPILLPPIEHHSVPIDLQPTADVEPAALKQILLRNQFFLERLKAKNNIAPVDLLAPPPVDPSQMDVDTPVAVKEEIPPPMDSDPPLEPNGIKPDPIKTEGDEAAQTTPEEEFPMPTVESDGLVVEFNAELASEVLKQAVALELSLYGFESASGQAVNVLTSALSSFIERIGYLCRSFIDVPGSTPNIVDVMQRTLSEVFPQGVHAVREFVANDILRFNNRMRNVETAQVDRFVNFGKKGEQFEETTPTQFYREHFLQGAPFIRKAPEPKVPLPFFQPPPAQPPHQPLPAYHTQPMQHVQPGGGGHGAGVVAAPPPHGGAPGQYAQPHPPTAAQPGQYPMAYPPGRGAPPPNVQDPGAMHPGMPGPQPAAEAPRGPGRPRKKPLPETQMPAPPVVHQPPPPSQPGHRGPGRPPKVQQVPPMAPQMAHGMPPPQHPGVAPGQPQHMDMSHVGGPPQRTMPAPNNTGPLMAGGHQINTTPTSIPSNPLPYPTSQPHQRVHVQPGQQYPAPAPPQSYGSPGAPLLHRPPNADGEYVDTEDRRGLKRKREEEEEPEARQRPTRTRKSVGGNDDYYYTDDLEAEDYDDDDDQPKRRKTGTGRGRGRPPKAH